VTPFQPSPLYDGEPTYIYHAAIRAPDDERVVVGGIGIVFHAGEEFRNMLLGGIAEKKNATAFYVNRAGRVLASTDPSRPVGSRLDLSADLLALPNGESRSRALVHDNQYAIVGCSASNGYREFKVSDGYKEDVLGVCFESFGAVRSDADDIVHRACSVLQSGANLAQGVEVATFFVDAGLYALPAEAVVEALPGHAVSPVSAGKLPWRVGTLARRSNGGVTGFVWVFDLGHMLRGRPSERGQDSQVIVIRHGGVEVGLLVNELHGVPAFPPHEITELPFLGEAEHSLVTRVIRANKGELLIQCLDVTRLVARLSRRAATGIDEPAMGTMQSLPSAAAPMVALPA
jgi:chemotaxis signal transduction protein